MQTFNDYPIDHKMETGPNVSMPEEPETIKCNKGWPNVDSSTIHNGKSYSPWALLNDSADQTPAYTQSSSRWNTNQKTNEDNHPTICNTGTIPNTNSTNKEAWGKYGTTIKNQQFGIRELPQVLTMKLVINVKIQYTTAEESYVWYYRLKCAVHPYGILLIPVEEFEPEKSLCPTTYYGLLIDPTHYALMSQALYQLLNIGDTSPRDCIELVNIVKKHASSTNGYAALYDIMTQIHPLLNPDAPFPAPSSHDCADIHDCWITRKVTK